MQGVQNELVRKLHISLSNSSGGQKSSSRGSVLMCCCEALPKSPPSCTSASSRQIPGEQRQHQSSAAPSTEHPPHREGHELCAPSIKQPSVTLARDHWSIPAARLGQALTPARGRTCCPEPSLQGADRLAIGFTLGSLISCRQEASRCVPSPS